MCGLGRATRPSPRAPLLIFHGSRHAWRTTSETCLTSALLIGRRNDCEVCLRCDWEGETKESACPNCGVLLYVLGAAQPKAAGSPARDDREELIHQPAPSLSSRLDPPLSPRTEASFRRSTGSAGAFVVAALVLIVASTHGSRQTRGGATTPESPDTNLDDLFAAPISQLDLPAPPAGVGPIENLPGWNSCSSRCRRELTVGGVPFSFRVPTRGWEAFGDISINKSIVGPQGAEAIIYWTTIPGDYANPCVDVFGWPVPRAPAVRSGNRGADGRGARGRGGGRLPAPELLAGPWNVRVRRARAGSTSGAYRSPGPRVRSGILLHLARLGGGCALARDRSGPHDQCLAGRCRSKRRSSSRP